MAPPDCIGCGREGSAVCEACAVAEIVPYGERCYLCGALSAGCRTCPSCQKSSPRHVWITTDYGGLPKEILRAYKFGHRRYMSPALAAMMAENLRDFNGQAGLDPENYLIVPVPTATIHTRERGFDHCLLLARRLSAELGLELEPALGRLSQARQVGAKRAERLKQQEGVFYVKSPGKLAGRDILLIDDVITTGATLRAATKALRAAGARRVDALAFAKRL